MSYLNYDDVVLVPELLSKLDSRDKASTKVMFCGQELNFPILAAPMPDVCDGDFADKLYRLGGLGVIHRFQPIDNIVKNLEDYNIPFAVSIGINGDWQSRFERLCESGCLIFCIDVANGFNTSLEKVINKIQILAPNSYIIAGNIASWQGYKYLNSLGVHAIRCGIAGGSVCSTKIETGIYSSMWSMLQEIRTYKNENNCQALIIADGNIKKPADSNKALCLADICMAGGIFAGTEESPGNIIKQPDGSMVKLFRGAASFSTQKYEAGKNPTYVEGFETFVPYCGALSKVVQRYTNGLKSCMSYFNANNLEELRKNMSYRVLN